MPRPAVSWWETCSWTDADLAREVPGWTPLTPGKLVLEHRKTPPITSIHTAQGSQMWTGRTGREQLCRRREQSQQRHRDLAEQSSSCPFRWWQSQGMRDDGGREGRKGTWCQRTKVLLARLRSWAFHLFYKSWHSKIARGWLWELNRAEFSARPQQGDFEQIMTPVWFWCPQL